MLLGYKKNVDPEWAKQCLQAWIETGSAKNAGIKLGTPGHPIASQTIQDIVWKYLLSHMDEARTILDTDARDYDNRFGRSLTDLEFQTVMTKKALSKYSASGFDAWVIENELYKIPKIRMLYQRRYPLLYEQHMELLNSEEVSE